MYILLVNQRKVRLCRRKMEEVELKYLGTVSSKCQGMEGGVKRRAVIRRQSIGSVERIIRCVI